MQYSSARNHHWRSITLQALMSALYNKYIHTSLASTRFPRSRWPTLSSPGASRACVEAQPSVSCGGGACRGVPNVRGAIKPLASFSLARPRTSLDSWSEEVPSHFWPLGASGREFDTCQSQGRGSMYITATILSPIEYWPAAL
jgi:hypothetical protein